VCISAKNLLLLCTHGECNCFETKKQVKTLQVEKKRELLTLVDISEMDGKIHATNVMMTTCRT